ncbi:hypothetical protein EX895_000046 [Sporisorium graminicola]|uniref:SigF-like NTF2-like domain-containing protein n=1 Tax=Sporisorium graminicola TaxID=280036 RepID=A0A4U7L2I1_9BASI|nr:hypothetical protein EX895_000046 [Sporisorium graminicola]TKY90048.1 hypothetical protein EX895_000046 [Sporisorium graminicola]
MEDPVSEIRGVVKGLVAARNASEQKYCMQRYFAPDASFDHVLCTVASGPSSRDKGLLPIYQFLRVISKSDIEVFHVAFDQQTNKLFLEAVQTLRPNLPVVRDVIAKDARIVVALQLQRGADGKFYIKSQQDLYAPQVLPFGIIPGGETVTMLVKKIAALNCIIMLAIVQLLFGYWKPGKDPLGSHLKRT